MGLTDVKELRYEVERSGLKAQKTGLNVQMTGLKRPQNAPETGAKRGGNNAGMPLSTGDFSDEAKNSEKCTAGAKKVNDQPYRNGSLV